MGLKFDEKSKELIEPDFEPTSVLPAIETNLKRLQRESIDVLLLHLNDISPKKAELLFSEMDTACKQGKVKSIGWSTDYPESIEAMSGRKNFVAVEHCLNVFVNTTSVQNAVLENDFIPFSSSPLAMGVLTGKYTKETRFSLDDNRSRVEAWRDYFVDSGVDSLHLERYRKVLCVKLKN